jgi:hypothetical protein
MTGMANATDCMESYRMESINITTGEITRTGNTNDNDACVTVLDLASLHPFARGFRRGFVGHPYVYLSPGEFNVLVRLNMEDFSIATVSIIDLDQVSSSLGGFSGGFVDGSWACFK